MNPVPYTICVLSEKMDDFQIWRNSKNPTDITENKKHSFISNGFRYMSIRSIDATRGWSFHGIIELNSAKYIKNIGDLMSTLHVHIR